MTTDTAQLSEWIGREVLDSDGDKIGKIADIYADETTGRPEWLAVTTSWFSGRVSFVPLANARPEAGGVRVPFDKSQVKGAPHADADGVLSEEEESRLYQHYGQSYGDQHTSTRENTGASDDAMTRSEEELRVGKTTNEAGRVRLRKWVDTEHVSRTVPVSHEEIRVEREPITDGNIDRAMSGPEIAENEYEVVLHEEKVVTDTEVVPKERIRLDKEVVTDEQEVGADLRHEHIEVEGDDPRQAS